MKLLAISLLSVGTLLATVASAEATSGLPGATSSAGCVDGFAGYAVGGASSCSLGGATAQIATYPYVALQTQSTAATETPGYSAGATADLTYYFEVLGGVSGTSVPVDISTNLVTSATYANYAFASILVEGAQTYVCTDTGSLCPGGQEFHGTLQTIARVGTAEQISFEIETILNGAFGGSANASADPFLFINPTFANARDYSIELSAGVGNGLAAVPEPASWALLLLGFGATGWMLRTRRKIIATA